MADESRFRIAHEDRAFLLALAAGLPASAISLFILWTGGYSTKVQWTLSILLLGSWLTLTWAVRERVAQPLRTLANLLEAMREGDYSIRARGSKGDALGEVMLQVNAMATTLRAQRLGALEATTLLRKVMEEIDVAVFAFDGEHKLKLINRAGERLINLPSERAMNAEAPSLDLDEYLTGDDTRTVQKTFPSGPGRWGIHRSSFREGGLPHSMLVITDLTRALREEELQAWQRIVRVLGHELNNSLAPIKSIAGSLETLVAREPRPDDWQDDMRSGLRIIATRSEGLSRFMASYARLAKLPRPQKVPMDVAEWIRSVAGLETRMAIHVAEGPATGIVADRDQLDQLLINLVRNAVDASKETSGGVTLSWRKSSFQLEVVVRDEGPGLANTNNLFVPFFTTKPGGSGIGLVLSRQIAEAHGGTLDLRNAAEGAGCEARLVLPV